MRTTPPHPTTRYTTPQRPLAGLRTCLCLCCCCVVQDVIPEDKQPELLGSISKGNISMRVLRDVFESFINMGPLSQVGVGQWRRHRGEGLGVQALASCQCYC